MVADVCRGSELLTHMHLFADACSILGMTAASVVVSHAADYVPSAALTAAAIPAVQSLTQATAPQHLSLLASGATYAGSATANRQLGSMHGCAGPDTPVTITPAGGTREWLYRLVTFPSYFTPCLACCGVNKTPKREQLITHFDTDFPTKVYCSHCPENKTRAAALLQVRRSAFKDVVKAADILRFGADTAGVQQYTLNGSKVIYLNRELAQEKKSPSASAAPATCTVDGRAMMDKTSLYCSLKCKLQAEDAGFNSWLDAQDPEVRLAASAAANAPPRPTIASKRCATAVTSSGSTARAKKAARTSSGSITAATGSASGHFGAARTVTKPRSLLKSSSSKSSLSTSFPSLPPIKTSRSGPPPSAFMEAAMADNSLLGLPTADAMLAGTHHSASSCLHDVQHAGSCSGDWHQPSGHSGGGMHGGVAGSYHQSWPVGSPSFAVLGDGWGDGALSPTMLGASAAGGSSNSSEDWWLSGSPATTFDATIGFGGNHLDGMLESDSGTDAGLLMHWPATASVLPDQLQPYHHTQPYDAPMARGGMNDAAIFANDSAVLTAAHGVGNDNEEPDTAENDIYGEGEESASGHDDLAEGLAGVQGLLGEGLLAARAESSSRDKPPALYMPQEGHGEAKGQCCTAAAATLELNSVSSDEPGAQFGAAAATAAGVSSDSLEHDSMKAVYRYMQNFTGVCIDRCLLLDA